MENEHTVAHVLGNVDKKMAANLANNEHRNYQCTATIASMAKYVA